MDKYLCVRVSLHGQMTLNHAKQHVRWRRSSGHSYADYSPVAKESLVHRVCKMDKSLESSGIQVDLIESLSSGYFWVSLFALGWRRPTTGTTVLHRTDHISGPSRYRVTLLFLYFQEGLLWARRMQFFPQIAFFKI